MPLDYCVKAVLDSRKDLGIALKNIDDFRIRLLEEPDRSRYESRPCSNVNSMVRGPKKDNAAGGIKNIVESLRLLSRLEQGLPQGLAFSFNLKKGINGIVHPRRPGLPSYGKQKLQVDHSVGVNKLQELVDQGSLPCRLSLGTMKEMSANETRGYRYSSLTLRLAI